MILLSCSISSLTPIVTGDDKYRNTELLATGILGSLRYQYWLLKAMQAWQDNPQHPAYPPCSADLPVKGHGNSFENALHDAESVVWLFGATNWKKMFRLEIAEAKESEQQSCSSRSDSKAPWKWTFKLIFRQDRKSPIFDELAEKEGFCLEQELRSLMAFVHQYGWLGAAPQNGLGWVTVESEGLEEKISLPENNPVFAAKDILLSKQEVKNLKDELVCFFEKKLRAADQTWKEKRYNQSIEHLKENHAPVGYEIRRWLRDQKFPQNKKEQERFFGGRDHAGFVHVTHPVVQQDDGWRLRLRFTVRPGENGGINPTVSSSPAAWLNDCCKLLKPEKPS